MYLESGAKPGQNCGPGMWPECCPEFGLGFGLVLSRVCCFHYIFRGFRTSIMLQIWPGRSLARNSKRSLQSVKKQIMFADVQKDVVASVPRTSYCF